ncbi:MAG TPA: hypothetical protein VF187_06445, partial [Gemmatimonadales bacterium]
MSGTSRTYRGAEAASGPLVTVGGAHRAAIGEWATIEESAGRRRGQVIEVSRQATVIQVFEDTVGLAPAGARVTLTGDVPRATVGAELFGRVLSGAGAPLDGLPAPVGEARRPVFGAPINPVCRRKPHDL